MSVASFTIYSVGSYEFLQEVLNSIAMIFSYGSGGGGQAHLSGIIGGMVASGLLLGLFGVAFQSLLGGAQKFDIHHVFMGLFIVLCFFNPKITADIHVEDYYTGAVKDVDNVPMGPAAAGFIISHIGYGFTSIFNQAFEAVTTDGSPDAFLEPLRQLSSVRRAMANPSVAKSLDVADGDNFQKTVRDYISECTMPKIQLGYTDAEKIRTKGMSELKFESSTIGTYVTLVGDKQGNQTCTDAWTAIEDRLAKATAAGSKTLQRINGLAGIKDCSSGTCTASTSLTSLQNSLNMLKLSGMAAQQYVQMGIIEPIYNQAVQSYYQSLGDVSASLMINQAITQRNIQWAAEQSMFMTVMRPFMAFFESFVYGCSPIIAFLVVLGPLGMALIGKYISLNAWLVLWYPCLDITNAFVMSAARSAMDAAMSGYLTNVSFYALETTEQIADNWLATGGMLTAATPLIALFLLTGSANAFTALTQRMAGGDHINEKIVAPDTIQPGAVMNMGNRYNYSAATGMATLNGSDSAHENFSITKMAQASTQRAHAEAETLSKTISAGIQRMIASGASGSDVATAVRRFGQALIAENGESYRRAESQAKSEGVTFSDDSSVKNMQVGAYGLSANGGLQLPHGIAGFGFLGQSGNSTQKESSFGLKGGYDEKWAKSFESNRDAALKKSTGTSNDKTHSVSGGETWSKADQDALGKQLSKLNQVTDTISRNQAIQNSFGVGATYQDSVALAAINKSTGIGGGRAKFEMAWNRFAATMTNSERSQYQSKLAKNMDTIGVTDPTQAVDLARQSMLVHSNRGTFQTDYLEALGTATGDNFSKIPSNGSVENGPGHAPEVTPAETTALDNANSLHYGNAGANAGRQESVSRGTVSAAKLTADSGGGNGSPERMFAGVYKPSIGNETSEETAARVAATASANRNLVASTMSDKDYSAMVTNLNATKDAYLNGRGSDRASVEKTLSEIGNFNLTPATQRLCVQALTARMLNGYDITSKSNPALGQLRDEIMAYNIPRQQAEQYAMNIARFIKHNVSPFLGKTGTGNLAALQKMESTMFRVGDQRFARLDLDAAVRYAQDVKSSETPRDTGVKAPQEPVKPVPVAVYHNK